MDISFAVTQRPLKGDAISGIDLIYVSYDADILRRLGGRDRYINDLTVMRATYGLDTDWTDEPLWDSATPFQKAQYNLEREAGVWRGYTHVLARNGMQTTSIGLRMDYLSMAEFRTELPRLPQTVLPLAQLMHAHFTKTHLPQLFALSHREKDVLSYLAVGFRPDEIADRLGVGYRTVDKYIVAAKEKLCATTLDHAVARALSLGLLQV